MMEKLIRMMRQLAHNSLFERPSQSLVTILVAPTIRVIIGLGSYFSSCETVAVLC